MSEDHPPERRGYARAEVVGSAIVLAEGRYVGTYILENLSASGALLLGHTSLPVGTPVRLLLQLQDRPRRLSISAAVVRHAVHSPQRAFAVQFFRIPPAVDDVIQSAVLQRRADTQARSIVLIVHPDSAQGALLERDLAELGYVPAAVHSPLDAVVWLQSRASCAAIVVADEPHPSVDGLGLLEFIGVDHPGVRRVLACHHAADRPSNDAIDCGRVDGLLETPWTAASLGTALGRCA